MGAISLLGWLAWPAIKWTVPSIGPKATLALIGAALAVLLMGAPALGVWIHMRGAVTQAELNRDAWWKNKLDIAETQHDWIVADAIDRAESVVLADDAAARRGPDHVARLLSADPRCRDCREKRR